MPAPLVNPFASTDIGNYDVRQNDPAFGGSWSALNPRSGKREELVQGENILGDSSEGANRPDVGQYGFLSENPEYANTVFKGPEKEMSQMTGLGAIFSNPATYLGIAGGMLGGAALGGGDGMAFGGESALQGSSYLGSEALSPAATGAITGGGNISGPLMEGLLTDPATGLPITPPMYEGGAPNFPGTPGNPVSNAADLARVLQQAGSPSTPGAPQGTNNQNATAPGTLSPGAQTALGTGSPTGIPGPGQGIPTPGTPTAPPAGPVGGSPVAGAPAGADAGGSMIDKILAQMKNNPLGAIGAGIGAAGLLGGKGKGLPNEDQINAMGGEAAGVARQLIQQYRSGTLSASQQAQIDQLKQGTKNQINQYFASIGQSDSTSHIQALAQVDQQALGMKQQMLDNALQQGLNAIGVAQGPLNTVAQYQLGQDKALRDAFGSFAAGVGNMAGRGAGTPTPAPTPAPSPTGTP